MEVLVILVSSGDKQADRAVVEAVWELLHEFDAMCRLLSNVRSPCLPLAKASMQLLTKMHNSKRFSVGPRSILQVSWRTQLAVGYVLLLGMLLRSRGFVLVRCVEVKVYFRAAEHETVGTLCRRQSSAVTRTNSHQGGKEILYTILPGEPIHYLGG